MSVEEIGVSEGDGRRVLEVVVIRPGRSHNGRVYSEAVLRESAGLWEGAPAFCDHPGPSDAGRAGGRSVRDLVGVYERARYEEGRGVVAELRLYPSGRWLGELLEAMLSDAAAGRAVAPVGISADLRVELGGRDAEGLQRVSRILSVGSADVVLRPAAGGRVLAIVEGDAAVVAEASEQPAREGELAREVSELRSELALARSGLSSQGQAFVRAQLAGRVVEAEEVTRAIESVRGLLATAGGSPVRGMGAQRGAAVITQTPRQRLQVSLDRLFGIQPPDHLSDVPRLSGIREAYIALTGDRLFDGRYHFENSVLEADEVTTTILADALLDSMTKRLVRDYRGQRRWWEPIAVKVPVSSLVAQNRIRLYDFAVLATVAENGPYVNLAWGDANETYTPVKKGSLVYVTLEAILADDVRAITRIPSKLALAANVTINESMLALFTANAGYGSTMTDTFPVINIANHANGVTTALSSTTLQAGMIAMAKQTNSASKVLGLRGRYLLVPPDLMYTAAVITGTERATGGANNDINPIYGQVEPIVVPNFTDVNNWYLLAAPEEIESLEVGFLNGREEPELLLQDSGTAGTVFTNDAISYKVRFIYGCGWLDYRGAYGGIVA